MRILFMIALRNLFQARRRTLFLSTALGIVTMLLVLLMALSQGISDNIVRSATTLTTGHVNVAGFFKTTPRSASPIITDTPNLKAIVEQNVDGIDYVVDRHRGWSRLVSPTSALQSLLVGVTISEEPRLLEVLELAPESDYVEGGRDEVMGDVERLGEDDTVVIFSTQAKNLEVKVGDSLTLRTQTFNGASNTKDVTIVGVAKDIGLLSNFSVFVPKQVILELYQLKPDTSGAVQIYLKDIDRSKEVLGKLRGTLEDKGYTLMEYQPAPFFAKFEVVSGEDWIGQRIDLTTWSDEVEFLTWLLTAIDTVSYSLVAILIVIIAVGVMNTMWISVRKRTTEIGTVRAIGMSKTRVLLMFIIEAALLGLMASTVGAAMGAIIALSINAAQIPVPVDAMRAILLSDTFVMSVKPTQLLGAVAMLTTFTVVSALWPSIRASRLQPVDAIQQAE